MRSWIDAESHFETGDVLVEAFGCRPPAGILAVACARKPVRINLEYLSAEDYVERMRAYPEIRQCCGISGETDMLVQVEAASMARLAEIRGVIEGFPGIQRVKTHMVVSEWAM